MTKGPNALFCSVLGLSACVSPAVEVGTGEGSTSTAPDPTSTSATSSSSGLAPAEGSTSTTTQHDESGSSSSGEVVHGPGCEPPPPCDRGVYEGAVRIESSDQIAEFAGYTAFSQGLEVLGTDLECLDFLGCLEEVEQEIRIFGNPVLRSTEGLSAVERVGGSGEPAPWWPVGSIVVGENPGLETLGGFTRIERIEAALVVDNNASLQSITGFTNVQVVTELVVRFNPALDSLQGLHDLLAIGGECQITNNAGLCVSEAFEVCGDLKQGPFGGNTQNNIDDC
ncbi:MAG: hypothetical protein ACRBN8_34330 [Nannocystales bacterium]